MCSTLDSLQCDFRSLDGDDFEDAVLVVLVVVELCVRSSQGPIILPFNSRPELFLYLFLEPIYHVKCNSINRWNYSSRSRTI